MAQSLSGNSARNRGSFLDEALLARAFSVLDERGCAATARALQRSAAALKDEKLGRRGVAHLGCCCD